MIYIVQSGSPKDNYIRIEMATKDMNKAVDVFVDLLIRQSELQSKLSIWVEDENLITEIDNTVKETLKQDMNIKKQVSGIVENKTMPYALKEHNQEMRNLSLKYTKSELEDAVKTNTASYVKALEDKDKEIKQLKEIYSDYKNTVLKLLDNQRAGEYYD